MEDIKVKKIGDDSIALYIKSTDDFIGYIGKYSYYLDPEILKWYSLSSNQILNTYNEYLS